MRFQSIIEISNLGTGSLAESTGLKVGDVIVSINGKKAIDLKLRYMAHLLKRKPGIKINLAVIINGVKLIYLFFLKSLL